jgi:hypothetical protein
MYADRNVSLGRFFMAMTLLVVGATEVAYGQDTGFTYQGRLINSGLPANGVFEFEFKVFDALTAGNQVGPDLAPQLIQVSSGVFTAQLDFGAGVFTGAARFLEIRVRPAGSPDPFSVLSPRQAVTSTPYAIRSTSAATADVASTANQLGGLSASGFIQNSTSQQASTNFNITGNGTIGGVMSATAADVTTDYKIGNLRVLSIAGTDNTFAGVGAGMSNTSSGNSFFGKDAGTSNTTGGLNSFFGAAAGQANSAGGSNSFFGALAGLSNTGGNFNAFFGRSAGVNNTTGGSNAFFGSFAGAANTTGSDNAFFGAEAGNQTTTGTNNAFFGRSAGRFNTTGGNNAFFGRDAGRLNTTGSGNAFVGAEAGKANTQGNANSFFGALAGLVNTTGSDNAFLGSFAGSNNTTGFNNAFFGRSAGQQNSTGFDNAFFGASAGPGNTTGNRNAFFGEGAGPQNSTGSDNTFIGMSTGINNMTGSFNTLIGRDANTGFTNSTNATALGSRALANCNDCVVLGSINGFNGATASTNVGIGTTNPDFRLQLGENSAAKPGSSVWTVASDRRLKQDIRPYTDGLSMLLQFHPVWYRYNGQAGLSSDKDYVGVIAQEAQAVAPYTVSASRTKLHPADAQTTELLYFDGGALIFMTINAIRELHAQVKGLRGADAGGAARLLAENAGQRQQLAKLQQRISDLEQRLEALEQRISKLPRE